MPDYNQMRQTMVDCQIRTAGVINPDLLNGFETVPREHFVPSALMKVAYNDNDVALGHGRYLLEPMVHAKLLQALNLKPEYVVLDIGGGTGYGAAIISSLVSTVVALESESAFAERANQLWQTYGYCNIAGMKSDLKQGCPQSAPYDAIILNGAVAEIPLKLLEQLAPEGVLACILKKPGDVVGQMILVKPNGSYTVLFDAGAAYLAGFEPAPAFQF